MTKTFPNPQHGSAVYLWPAGLDLIEFARKIVQKALDKGADIFPTYLFEGTRSPQSGEAHTLVIVSTAFQGDSDEHVLAIKQWFAESATRIAEVLRARQMAFLSEAWFVAGDKLDVLPALHPDRKSAIMIVHEAQGEAPVQHCSFIEERDGKRILGPWEKMPSMQGRFVHNLPQGAQGTS